MIIITVGRYHAFGPLFANPLGRGPDNVPLVLALFQPNAHDFNQKKINGLVALQINDMVYAC